VDRIYSSPFYRCLETINPLADLLDLPILCENGIGEWYGLARFDHPSPAPPELLHSFFPRVRTAYNPVIVPSTKGEPIAEIHDRVAYALARIIEACDEEWRTEGKGVKTVLLVGHAASNIAMGRALVGDPNADVKTGTCSLSVYRRRSPSPVVRAPLPVPSEETPIPETGWRGGRGVGGGWVQVLNGDCGFLTNGEERNWWFQGDESWDFPVVKEGMNGAEGGLTAAVEGGIKQGGIGGPGTLPESGKAEEVLGIKKEDRAKGRI
jgi:transcription factor C subunit 7